MKLPLINRLSKENLKSKDLPAWIEPFIGMLNGFLEPIVTAVRGKLTFADNFLCDVKTYPMTHATPLSVAVNPKLRVIGAIPLVAEKSTDSAAATQGVISGSGIAAFGNGTITLVANFAGGSGIQASVTWVILYG